MGDLIIKNGGNLKTRKGLCPNVGNVNHQRRIIHCVGHDGGMSAGFALHVPDCHKEQFRNIHSSDEWRGHGYSAVTYGGLRPELYVHLVTKELSSGLPTLETLEEALDHFAGYAKTTSEPIDWEMPQIGCGIDGLFWKDVLPLIDKTARKINGTITVYVLDGFQD